MADFTDEKQTVDLCSDHEDADMNSVVTRGNRPPPPDQDGAPIALIPRSSSESVEPD